MPPHQEVRNAFNAHTRDMAEPEPARSVWEAPSLARSHDDEWVVVPPTPRDPRPLPVGERVCKLVSWSACGILLSASLLLFPIGLLALPIAVGLGLALLRRGRSWPEVLGLAPGISTFLAFVAYRNRDSVPCSRQPIVGASTPGMADSRCGGVAPEPWLVLALAVVAVAAGAYALALFAEYQRRE